MATRIQVRRGTTSEWNTANPTLEEGEIGYNSTLGQIKIGDGDTVWADLDYFVSDASLETSLGTYLQDSDKSAIDGVAELDGSKNILAPASIIFEGTANDHETTLAVTDPTADRTITFPDVTGTVITTGNLSDITNIGVFTSTIVMEGATANDFELTLSAGDPTADRTITFPDATGTVALTSDIAAGVVTETGTQTLTNKTLTSPIVTGLTVNDGSIVIEGATADNFETTLVFTDPTGDRTITFQDLTGTVALLSDISAATGGSVTETATQTLTNKTLTSPKINEDVILTSTATELNYVDGVTSSIQTQINGKLGLADPAVDYYITNSGSGAYIVNGVSNGSLYFEKGKKYRIHINATGHPFWIQTSSGAYNSENVYSTGITNNGTENGHILVELAQNAPQLYYACQYHSSMAGSINIGSFASNLTLSGDLTINGTTTTVNSTTINVTNAFVFEGATADNFETTLTVTDPTADRTITLPDSTGTVALTTDLSSYVPLSTFDTKGDLLIASADNTVAKLAVGTNGYILTANSSATNGVEWAAAPVSYSAPTIGSTSIASGATVTTIAGLTLSSPSITGSLTAGGGTGTSGQVLVSTGSGVQWSTPAAGAAFSEFMLIGA